MINEVSCASHTITVSAQDYTVNFNDLEGFEKLIEEDEIADEAYRPSSFRDVQFPTKGVKKGTLKDLKKLED